MSGTLVASNFECFPANHGGEFLQGLVGSLGSVHFTYAIQKTNSFQFSTDFDEKLEAALHALGVKSCKLALPVSVEKECDFAFELGGHTYAVEVEKANRHKILYDFLKMHVYFKAGATKGLLFLPRCYPHTKGEWPLFSLGRQQYDLCRRFGFGRQEVLDNLVLVGYDQHLPDETEFRRPVRTRLIEEYKALQLLGRGV